MRNYTQLHITYTPGGLEGITAILPERAKCNGAARGLKHYDSNSYIFEPPLTKEELMSLTGKLIDLDIKKFTFEDTLSLSKNN